MVARSELDGEWRSFYREYRRDAIADLAAAYPDERSLYVDMVDLHRYDPAFAEALLADPDTVLAAGTAVLRDLDDGFDRVNVRVENHPGLLSPGGIRTQHVGELVAVQGIVAELDPVGAALERGVYECRACDSAVARDHGWSSAEPPSRCDECGTADALALDRGRSEFVDVRRLALAALPGEHPDDHDPPAVDVRLDDDLVDAVDPGQQLLATGIVRLEAAGRRFEFAIDGVGVSEERPGGIEEEPSPGEALQDVIASRWERAAEGS